MKLNKGDIKTTQGNTGHAQIDMITDVYAHILDEDRKVSAQRFGAAFYSGCDLNTVKALENEQSENLENIIKTLQQSPELTSMLSKLITNASSKS